MTQPIEMQHSEYVVEARQSPASAGVLPGWEQEDRDDPSKNTHLWIILESLDMVATLGGSLAKPAFVMTNFAKGRAGLLRQGNWDADYVSPWNDHLWLYHFYDPDSGTNYDSCDTDPELCHETARVWGSKCHHASLQAYAASDYSAAAYQLGLALHFLTDLGQPMHAANFTVASYPGLYHQMFEHYVIGWTDRTNPPPIPYEQSIVSDSFEGFIDAAARLAKPRMEVIRSTAAIWEYNSGGTDSKKWQQIVDPEIDGALQDIRKVTAQYLLMWVEQAISMRPASVWSCTDVTKNSQSQIAQYAGFAAAGWGDQERIFFLDGSEHVNVLIRQSNGGWQGTDLTAQTDAPAPAESMLAASTSPGADAANRGFLVTFLDSQAHIVALIQPPGSDWELHDLTHEANAVSARTGLLAAYATACDLTAATQAPPMDGAAIAGYAWDLENMQMIVYLESQGHIHELGGFQHEDDPWASPWHADLTGITDAPTAVGTLLGATSWLGGYVNGKQVAYCGQDNHVYELSIVDAEPWGWTDLTVAADAPAIDVTALTYLEWQKDESKHVSYLDRDGNVHDLSLGPSGAWTYVSLNEVLKAPRAAGTALGSFAHDEPAPARLGIAYTDGYGHVQLFTAEHP